MSAGVRHDQRRRLHFEVVKKQEIEVDTAFTPVSVTLPTHFKFDVE